eukprot:CAMPEP_0174293106 /NCGR_PEP_ID=MMETSP0809-20121228/37489_1 /TAXON_ID=73025 ORGANISM="Eutreptiella gymnastica-like, Strain CCMP1594" /NCGR_SAMPLE_ID=MMETSP0809 /ASSEMBLY_ACC=CAM_ASM_000658 /LENGTH=62 /DNA_ID=CAMNT_0015393641 /DNA_START=94 /DNA_END=282 /DNA_ORIENTATION=-
MLPISKRVMAPSPAGGGSVPSRSRKTRCIGPACAKSHLAPRGTTGATCLADPNLCRQSFASV